MTFEYTVKGVIFFGDSSSAAGSLNTVGFRFRIWPSAPCPEPRKGCVRKGCVGDSLSRGCHRPASSAMMPSFQDALQGLSRYLWSSCIPNTWNKRLHVPREVGLVQTATGTHYNDIEDGHDTDEGESWVYLYTHEPLYFSRRADNWQLDSALV